MLVAAAVFCVRCRVLISYHFIWVRGPTHCRGPTQPNSFWFWVKYHLFSVPALYVETLVYVSANVATDKALDKISKFHDFCDLCDFWPILIFCITGKILKFDIKPNYLHIANQYPSYTSFTSPENILGSHIKVCRFWQFF